MYGLGRSVVEQRIGTGTEADVEVDTKMNAYRPTRGLYILVPYHDGIVMLRLSPGKPAGEAEGYMYTTSRHMRRYMYEIWIPE